MFRAIFYLILFVLTGCTTTGQSNHFGENNQLTLHQPIPVKPGSSYAYVIAPGKIVSRDEIGTYDLYCKFSLPRSKNSGEYTIEPGVFTIRGIHHRYSLNHMLIGETQVAYRGGFIGIGGIGSRSRASKVDLELHIGLSSEQQPLIKSLICVKFADPEFYRSPKISDASYVMQGLAEFTSKH